MVIPTQLAGQDLDAPATGSDVHQAASSGVAGHPAGPAGRLATAGEAYAAARAALDAALPAGWRHAAVETLPADRVALTAESDLGDERGMTVDRSTAA